MQISPLVGRIIIDVVERRIPEYYTTVMQNQARAMLTATLSTLRYQTMKLIKICEVIIFLTRLQWVKIKRKYAVDSVQSHIQ